MKFASLFFAGWLVATAAWCQSPIFVSIAFDSTTWNGYWVDITVEGELLSEATYYQFASTAPGTYQRMDIGRYASQIQVQFDGSEAWVSVEKSDVNRVELGDGLVTGLRYHIAETWDTPVDSFPIYPMAGSSVEPDHALISPHALVGYFEGLQ